MGKVNLASSSTQFALLAKAAKPLKAATASASAFKAAAIGASTAVAQKSLSPLATQAAAKPAAPAPAPAAPIIAAAVATSAVAPTTTSGSDSISLVVQKAAALKVSTVGLPTAVANMLETFSNASAPVVATEALSASNISPEVQKFIAWQNAQPNTFGRGTVGDLWQGDNVSVARVAQAQEMIDRESRRQAVLAGVGMSTANLFAWNKFNPGGTSIV